MPASRTASIARRAATSLVLLAFAALALVALRVPGANGAFLAKITNSTDTAATATYFTCTNYASDTSGAVRATFDYPLGEALDTGVAADVSGNATNAGTYSATGVTPTANSTVCPRDAKGRVASFNGSTGYVTGPATPVTGPTTFTIEAWFKTSTAAGKIIGFGGSPTGSSTNYDRHIYIGSDGYLYFGVFPNPVVTITNKGSTLTGADATAVNDGQWHFAVATMLASGGSSGAGATSGMSLYLDGTLVATNTNTVSQSYSGYWRIGYDNIGGWTNQPSSFYFNGQMAWVAAYNGYALGPTQIAAQYVAGR